MATWGGPRRGGRPSCVRVGLVVFSRPFFPPCSFLSSRPSPPGTLEDIIYTRQIYKEQHSKMVLEGEAQPRMFEGARRARRRGRGARGALSLACCA